VVCTNCKQTSNVKKFRPCERSELREPSRQADYANQQASKLIYQASKQAS
jgi:hypothetical protein